MKHYAIELLVSVVSSETKERTKEWRKMRPSDSNEYYNFKTKEEAERILRMCYPNAIREEVRIVETTRE